MDETKTDKPWTKVEGVVSSFDVGKGWGFITFEGSEKDVFVHHEAIEGHCERHLVVGERVRFELVNGPKGPRAAAVEKIDSNGDTPGQKKDA